MEMVEVQAAESHVGTGLGYKNLADQCYIRFITMNATAGAGPNSARLIQSQAIEETVHAGGKDPPACQSAIVNIENSDMAWAVCYVGSTRISNVEMRFVG